MNTIVLDLQYMAPIAYFAIIAQADEVILESHEHFVKQTHRNRCRIMGSDRLLDLSVPVHFAGKKIPVQELKIDYRQKWVNNHWRAIQSAYGKSPFFDYYGEAIHDVLYSKPERLFDLNQTLLTICLNYLQIDTPIRMTAEFVKEYSSPIFDLRSVIHPKKPTDGLIWYKSQKYVQTFGKDFVPNLSIIDLLFCEGPMAGDIVKRSFVKH